MSVLEKVEQSPFVYFGFNPSEETPDNPWAATAIICTSEDGIHWIPVKEFPELGNFRDGNIAKIGDEYWLIGTFAIYRTKDFESFDYFSLNEIIKPNYTEIWAPEFVQDRNTGDWKIVYVANNNGIRRIYFADFNPQTGEVTNPYQGTNVIGEIDPTIHYINGQYLMITSGHFFVSDELQGHYVPLYTNIYNHNANWFEAPELLIAGNKAFFYQDKIYEKTPGVADTGDMVFAEANSEDLTRWTDNQLVDCPINMRHGSFLYNYTLPSREEYFPNIKPDSSLGTKVI